MHEVKGRVKEKHYWLATFQIWLGQVQIEKISSNKSQFCQSCYLRQARRWRSTKLHDIEEELFLSRRNTSIDLRRSQDLSGSTTRQAACFIRYHEEICFLCERSFDHAKTIPPALLWTSVQIVVRMFRRRDLIAGSHIQWQKNRYVFVFVATTEQYVVTTEFNW